MNPARFLSYLLVGLFIICFSLSAWLQPRFQTLEMASGVSDNFFSLILGDSSRIFANDLFTKADAYYHSGFYPTIFDNNEAFKTPHIAEDTGAVASHNEGEELGFMGPPRDWIDAFGRHFIPNRHTHLDEGGPNDDLSSSSEVREILPWLKLSSKLDPENIQTYLVIAFWLRTTLHDAPEAEQVLREGLRNNPGNPQLLFELGRIDEDDYHEPAKARNVWEAGLRTWALEKPGVPKSERLKISNENFDDRDLYDKLEENLAKLEADTGNYSAAIAHFQEAQLASTKPADLQKQINDLKQKELKH